MNIIDVRYDNSKDNSPISILCEDEYGKSIYLKEIHSHWISRAYEPLQCANCGRRLSLLNEEENYCPECGALMDRRR